VEAAAIEAAAGKAMLTIELAIVLPIDLAIAAIELAIEAAAIELAIEAAAVELAIEATAASWCHGPDVVPVKTTAGATAHSRVELLHGAKPHVTAGACCCCLRQGLVLQTPDAGRLTSAAVVGAASDRSKAIHGIPHLRLLISLRAPAPISNEEVALLTEVLLLTVVLDLTVTRWRMIVLVRLLP